ncbi:branched-chain amino acid ABC transporter permease (plasmid) [Rhizobium sp. ACO-34A]|nr:branched-chain amino acid ABC transporter permease [Rhizobium sp. ACO-34A]ATN37403.1 branched-chain amino acid ABC transporter permease [Rhizobium sp. ACO-34A]
MRVTNIFLRDCLIALACFAFLLALGLVFPSLWLMDTLTALFASGLLAMSLHLLIGYTGLVSFGHAAYFAAGAYIFGLLLKAPDFVATFGAWSVPLGIVAAVLGTALFALIVGLICARLSEIYFAFLTLAFQMLFISLIQGFVSFTGGDQGLTGGIPRPAFLGIDLTRSWDRYGFSAFVFVAGVLVIRLVTESSFGYTLRMVRDNERRTSFLGVNTYRVKVISFTIAGSVAALGGVILAIFTSAAFPEWAGWAHSGEAIFMIMLGGVNSFFGPILGAMAMRLINDVTLLYTTHTELTKGIVILFAVLVLKRGILDYAADLIRGRRAQGHRPSAVADVEKVEKRENADAAA